MTVSLPVFLLRRLATIVFVVVTATALTFVFFRVARPEIYAFDDRSVLTALLDYLDRAFLHFDFGVSFDAGNDDIATLIRQRFGADVSLVAGAVVIGVLGGLAGGVVCAARPDTVAARLLYAGATLALCAPVYWMALVAVYLFGPDYGQVELPIFVALGTYVPLTENPVEWAHSLLAPWLIASLPLGAMCLRMTRSTMVGTLQEEYVRTAVAKGVPDRQILRRHAAPVATAPVVSLTGANMTTVVANVLLLEQIFNVPGMFRLTTSAIADENYPVLQAITVLAALLVVVGNSLADLILAWLDPRVRA